MSETPRPGRTQDTWEVFFEAVRGAYSSGRHPTPIPEREDPAHPGVRAMQRGRRCAWTHARHVRGLSMFESIRLSERLAEAFCEWTRSGADGEVELAEALRRTEEEARSPAPLEAHAAFVEAFARLSGRESYGSPMDTALDALRELRRRRSREAGGEAMGAAGSG
ncbi:MAG TPA: hypothetical protein VF615_01760 [Longimicrobiaceae bacterium]|jgi:hypothetical protein